MSVAKTTLSIMTILLVLLCSVSALAQSSASIDGRVMDQSGGTVPNAEVTLTAAETGISLETKTSASGMYYFANLPIGSYQLKVSASGFRNYIQSGIVLKLNVTSRVDIELRVGQTRQTIRVVANASQLNFKNATVGSTISPHAIQDLPLMVSGSPRSAAAFAILLPGVSTGDQNTPISASFNGGMTSGGDAALLDGASMQESTVGQSGMVAIFGDFPVSPDSVQEMTVLTSNYSPQYGNTNGAVITAVTKSGTNRYHGAAYEYLRNTVLNARQFGIPDRPFDIENDFGGNIGGPVKIPWVDRRNDWKTFFFFNYEGYRSRGGVSPAITTVPTMQERNGDFSDWVDGTTGNLIPIYDPSTTQPNPNYNPAAAPSPTNLPYLRQQFPGNVIPPSRLQNSLANAWLKYLPSPNLPGILNNYSYPVASGGTAGYFANRNLYDVRADQYLGAKNHITATIHWKSSWPVVAQALFPPQITSDSQSTGGYNNLDRLNYDRIISPTVLNHFDYGYNSTGPEGLWSYCVDHQYADTMPQIPGVPDHTDPPVIYFQQYAGLGCNGSSKSGFRMHVFDDMLTWIHGDHTFVFGGQISKSQANGTGYFNNSGTFSFADLNTGLIGVTSGNSLASFLLGEVSSASVGLTAAPSIYARQTAWALYAGDTWRVIPRLSIDYGVRWDVSLPIYEKNNNLSFIDPNMPNPGAGNRLGALAFAGTQWGADSFGRRYPENNWYGGVGPRLGIAYRVGKKSVVRAGYGIFFNRIFYPGWGSGMNTDGFNSSPTFTSSLGGLSAPFLLSQGLPPIPSSQVPPFVSSSFDNGQYPGQYRPFGADRLPYTQQWNLTIEHQFGNNMHVSVAYVGNKGTRLLSAVAPLNALNPRYLSLGQQLYDQFQPGQTVLDGVASPYPGWAAQMTGCPPTVAQALLPYPQYCGNLNGLDENAGNSTYNSLQVEVKKTYSTGLWFLGSYTWSKWINSGSDTIQGFFNASTNVISPFERQRNKSISEIDVPQLFSLAMGYHLPFGRGQHFLNNGDVLDKVVGGWDITSIFRASSGIPFHFSVANCNVPSQFAASCVPAILSGADVWAQSKSNFDPSKPLFNAAAFQGSGSNGLQFNFGQGPRVTNLRGFGYHNQDLALIKTTPLSERIKLKFEVEASNLWNWHTFTSSGQFGAQAFDTAVGSPTFGMWNGSVSAPRNIQFAMRIEF